MLLPLIIIIIYYSLCYYYLLFSPPKIILLFLLLYLLAYPHIPSLSLSNHYMLISIINLFIPTPPLNTLSLYEFINYYYSSTLDSNSLIPCIYSNTHLYSSQLLCIFVSFNLRFFAFIYIYIYIYLLILNNHLVFTFYSI